MVKKREAVQVSPEFKKFLDRLQIKIINNEQKIVSQRDITERIVKMGLLNDIETKILNTKVNIRMDRRILWIKEVD